MQNTSSSEQTGSAVKTTAAKVHTITRNDLPLSCPLPSASQWNAHPRVFLSLNEEGKAICPYCSTVYILQDD